MPQQPNILLIISDQWSTRIADGSGTAPYCIRTSAVDQLAREGIRFTQSYATFPLCNPNRSTMFTGLYPHHHRMTDNEEVFMDKYGKMPTRTDIATMGAVFKRAGYNTAYFGKEHAGNYGWDSIDEFGTFRYSGGGMLAEGSCYDPVFTRDAVNYLNHYDSDDPFYMVVSLINPHDICKVLGGKVQGATIADAIFFCRTDDELYLRYQQRPDLPPNFDAPAIDGMIRHNDYMYEELQQWTVDEWKRYVASYGLMVENTDWNIQLVLNALQQAGLEEDTIVIFTTDHGEMLSSHRLISKINFYEESAKTMMIVKQPNVIEAGAVNQDAFIGTIDLMPTMIDLCDIDVPDGLDGKSFKYACYGDSDTGFDEVYGVNHDGRMLRWGSYKYVRSKVYGDDYHILFDLVRDPDETTNVYSDPNYHDVATLATEKMDNWLSEQGIKVAYDPI
ncbi:MAG: sulfatase-like hydrolase/transferase [Chloroflexota bacterium]